jgi:hypothetical protein
VFASIVLQILINPWLRIYGREDMNVHDLRFWVTNSGMVIGLLGQYYSARRLLAQVLFLGLEVYFGIRIWKEKSGHKNNARELAS